MTTHSDTTSQPAILAIDLGSSAFKAIAVSLDPSQPIALLHRADAPQLRCEGAASTFDPVALELAINEFIDATAAVVRGRGLVLQSIALTGAIGSVLLVGADGQLQSPCITWADQRSQPQAAATAAAFREVWPALLGHDLPQHTCWGLPKIRHLCDTAIRTLSSAAHVLQLPDVLALKLTGRTVSHPTAWIGLANQQHRAFSQCLVDWAGLRREQLPTFATASLTPAMAARFGQAHATPVVPAGGDMYAGFRGFHATPTAGTSEACLIAGTTEILGLCHVATIAPPPRGLIRLQLTEQHAITYGSTNHGGASMHWLARQLELPTQQLPGLIAEAAALPTPSRADDALLFIPHIGGARAPHWQAQATGGFVNQQPHHTPAHLTRGVIEGCALAKRSVLDAAVAAVGVRPARVLAAGGGGDAFTHQTRANILALPIHAMPDSDITAIGAALQAMGDHAATWAAQHRQLHAPAVYAPDASAATYYDQLYIHYQRAEAAMLQPHGQSRPTP